MSGWWYVSVPNMTAAVKVERGVIVEAPPILQKFVGQPSKNLGKWMRAMGDFKFERLPDMTHIFGWGNNPKRATMKGRPCRVIARGTMRSVLIEFADGQREIVSYRSLREIK